MQEVLLEVLFFQKDRERIQIHLFRPRVEHGCSLGNKVFIKIHSQEAMKSFASW